MNSLNHEKDNILLVFISINAVYQKSAKSNDSSAIQGLLQYIVQPLDKNQVPNGYLEEYGFSAISMRHYNDAVSDTNIVELNLWRLLYCLIKDTKNAT